MLATFFRSRQSRDDLYSFPGGIHPPEMKHLSNQSPIRPGPIPDELILPLTMHLGVSAKPRVNVGDQVLKGECLADPQSLVSAAIHAPTSGTVIAIEQRPVQHPSGLTADCIVLRPDGQDRWAERQTLSDYQSCSAEDVLRHLRRSGIAGMGGAGFPTDVKLNIGDHHHVEELIINGVECEPYITADDRLMREQADDMVTGIQILQYLLNPRRTLLALEDNKPEAISIVKRAIADTDISLCVVPTRYPSGGEKQLIQLLTGKEVASGSLPAKHGVICQNVATAAAVKRAVIDGEPLISRITTLTGDAISYPGNYQVLIGTPVKALLQAGALKRERLDRLIMGGPMMGFTLNDPDVPLVKTSNCIIAASDELLPPPPAEQPCIRCGACAEVCPASLLPQQLYWYAKNDELDRAKQYSLMDCIECGACAYVCPSNIPLVQYYRYAKGEIRHQAAEQAKADKARQRFEARQARIEQELADKEARRQARLDANRKPKQAPQAVPQSAPADTSSADLEHLKQQSLAASKAYKAAVKAAKQAAQDGSPDAAQLQQQADSLKAEADKLKAAVRDAKTAPAVADAPSSPENKLDALKKQVGEASSRYKQAVKAAKAAAESEDPQAAALQQHAEQLKAQADELKKALREAKSQTPAATTERPAAATTPTTDTTPAAQDVDGAQKRQKKINALKTAYNIAHKHYKEAHAALERAERADQDDPGLADMRARVDKLKAKADVARDTLNELIEQAKADLLAHTGKDLKTLKLDTVRADQRVDDKRREIAEQRDTASESDLEVLNGELKQLEQARHLAHMALKQALQEQGLTDA